VEPETLPHAIELLVGLLVLATFVAIVVRPLRIPYTVALVVAGLLVGGAANVLGIPALTIDPDLVLVVLLPGLVFEAGYRLRVGELRRWWAAIGLLAIPGVIVSAVIVAVVLTVATGLPIELAFIVGAMVSATDPAAVVATFRQLRTDPSLATMVDGESLLNDGTGLVLFAIAVEALVRPWGAADAVIAFVGAILVSVVIGLATGYVAARVVSLVDDHLIELTISVILAYGSYMIADEIHLSGVLATVTAAVVFGNVGPGRVLSDTGADAIDTVWEFLASLLTAVVFLIVGLAIPPARLLDSIVPIVWAVVGATIGRALIVYGLLGGLGRLAPFPGFGARLPAGWLHVIFWSGLRGAVAVAMALSLPASVPQRDVLQAVVFGVVLFTLLVQGTTVGPLTARVAAPSPEAA
jgi:monovalent cation:H+ antiporter, CPA1 family